MLEGELWIKSLADKSGIDYQNAETLWAHIISMMEKIWEQGDAVFIIKDFCFYIDKTKEFILKAEDNKFLLMPPKLGLKIATTQNHNAINIFDLEFFDELKKKDKRIVSWIDGIKDNFQEIISENKKTYIQSLGYIEAKSINENETIISFEPDESLSTKINKAFSIFSNIDISDRIDSFSDLDIVENIDNFIQRTSSIHIKKQKEVLPIIEQDEKTSSISEINPSDNITDTEVIISDIATNEPDKTNEQEEEKTDKKNKFAWLFYAILLVGLFILLSKLLWSFGFERLGNQKETSQVQMQKIDSTLVDKKDSIINNIENDTLALAKENKEPIKDTTKIVENRKEEKVVPQKKESSKKVESKSNTTTKANNNKQNIKETIQINQGDTLTKLALNKYGHKIFWVYIYTENISNIKNPNNIPIGTSIVLPPADKYNIDAKNTNSLNNAFSLEREIKKHID